MRLSLAGAVAATSVLGVTVSTGDGERFTGELQDGELRFAPVTTTELTLRLEPGDTVTAHEPYLNKVHPLSLGLTEVEVLGASATASRGGTAALSCGSGPTLRVGDQAVTTRLTASVDDLLARREVRATPCGAGIVDLAGTARVSTAPSDLANPTRVVLAPATAAAAQTSVPATITVDRWTANDRLVTVAPHSTDLMLTVSENTNPGWTARLGDVTLTPTVVDGWQQAWIIPAGLSGQVELSFTADTTYRTALAVGAALLLLVVLAALIPARAGRATLPAHRDGIALPLVGGSVAFVIVAGALGALVAAVGIAIVAFRTVRPYARLGIPWLRRLWDATAWLVPSALLGLGAAAWVVVWEPHKDWIPQVLGILAVAAVWMLALATGAPPRAVTVPRK